ncbi:MAG: C13 family peptidase [Rhodanobacteraceae bacterium]
MRTTRFIILGFLIGVAATVGVYAWKITWHCVNGEQTTHASPIKAVSTPPAAIAHTPIDRKSPLTPESPPSLLPDKDWPQDAPTPEQVIYDQSRLLDKEIAQLKPRTPGKVNLYALVFAGDGGENVFRNEAEYFEKLFSQRFGATGHVLVLENNPAALTTRPLADWSNLEVALDALASKMDMQNDIMLLYFTSHGSEDHFLYVDMDPLPLDQIGASDMASILKKQPFHWKVIVVNACYSGGFIPPLRGAGTLVITAARADRSSFGCGAQSQITYFSHAFLDDALNRTNDPVQAFSIARKEVATWEKSDGYISSQPQIDIGAGIAAKLAQWEKQSPPGAAVPFLPASDESKRASVTAH